MAGVKVNFSVDSSQAKAGFNNVKKEMKGIKTVGKDASSGLDEVGRSTDGAIRALDSLGGACGLASTGFSGLAGDIMQLATSKTSLFIAAIATIIAAIVAVYDMCTQSGDQFAAMVQVQATMFEKNSRRLEQMLKKQQKYFNRLKQLGKLQSLTNEQRNQAVFILDSLKGKYGELGIQIDNTTGKLKNLQAAEQQFARQQLDKQIEQKRNQIKLAYKKLTAALVSDVDNQFYGNDRYDLIVGAGHRSYWNAALNSLTDEQVQKQGIFFQIPDRPNSTWRNTDQTYALFKKFRANWNEAAQAKDLPRIIHLLTDLLQAPAIKANEAYINAIKDVLIEAQDTQYKVDELKQLKQTKQFLLNEIKSRQSEEKRNNLRRILE